MDTSPRHAGPAACANPPGLPPDAIRLLDQARAALAQRQPAHAERALAEVLARAPDCADALRLLPLALQLQGHHAGAVKALRRALDVLPDEAMLHMALGISAYESGAVDAADQALQRACALAPDMAAPWFNHGRLLRMQGRMDPARACLGRALRIDPCHIPARLSLAEVHTGLGDIDAAATAYREILRRQPDHAAAWNGLANLKTVQLDARDTRQLQSLFRPATARPPREQVELGFALAKALEDQGAYPEAFDVLRQANRLKRRSVSWDAAAQSARIEAIRQAFVAPVTGATDPALGREVIFVVSLPRTGSTLVEQILASHAQVEGGNELQDLGQVLDQESQRRGQPFPQWVAAARPADWTRLGRDYLARTAAWRQRRPRFTDKNLLNWQLVGAAMAMLPGARVVNCRRDPLESCLAGYRQLFSRGNDFSYALDEMVAYWRDYDRLCRHWRALFPQCFHEHVHESLLHDPDAEIRRLLAFCGLDFDPACLDFHRTARVVRTASAAQVRQPLQRDTARSARYGDKLEPLRSLLATVR